MIRHLDSYSSSGARKRPTVPVGAVALACGTALVLANLVVFVPGRIAAHTAAAVLRAE